MARVMKGAHNIIQSQIIQDALDHLIIKFVPNEKFSEKDLDDFKGYVGYYIDSDIKITYEQVTALPKTERGENKVYNFPNIKLED